MQRSGSGWFETLLNNHPNISSHGEIFSVKGRRDNFSSIEHNLDVVFNLDWMNSAAKNECTAAVGFKWMLNQGPMEYHNEVLDYFERMGVSVILLLRRNVLKRLISIMANAYDQRAKPLNGTHKSHVHSVEEALKLAEYKPVIDVNNLLNNLQRVEDMANSAQNYFKNTRMKVVYYEDLVTQPERLNEVLEFLGVPLRKLESQQVKIHTRPLREQVQNWDEVLALLKGTKYEVLVNDDDYTS
jgi:LPS sulfotransferase NodH